MPRHLVLENWGRSFVRLIECRARRTRLAGQLAGIKGRFILSLNDVREVRDIFGRFHIEEVSMAYKLSGTKKVTEPIISRP